MRSRRFKSFLGGLKMLTSLGVNLTDITASPQER